MASKLSRVMCLHSSRCVSRLISSSHSSSCQREPRAAKGIHPDLTRAPLHRTGAFRAGESPSDKLPTADMETRPPQWHVTMHPSSEEELPDCAEGSCTPALGRACTNPHPYPPGGKHACLPSSLHTGEEIACCSALQVDKRKV